VREELAGLAALPEGERAAVLARAPEARPAVAAVRAVRRRQRPYLLAIRCAAALLAATIFAGWPLAAYGPPAVAAGAGAVLAATAALVVTIATLAFLMLVACGERTGRAAASALHLLYPVAALHPLSHASRDLYRRFDAMTTCAALLPARAFLALAARELRRAEHSRAATAGELDRFWRVRTRALAGLLEATGSSEAEALAAPAPMEGAAAFCPVCGVQYRPGFERCSDCGVAVQQFGAA
jgi:hypothetical protein